MILLGNMDSVVKLMVAILPPFITFLGALITAYLIPQLKAKKELDTEEKRQKVILDAKFWVDMAVRSAEQLYKDMPKSGAEKKQYVLNYLNSKGINLSMDELNVLIESAVKELELLEKDFIKTK